VAAGASGFLTLIHVLDGPERYGAGRISFDVGCRPNFKGNNARRAPMRILTLTLTMFALSNQGGAALAQQDAKDVTVEAIPIEKVLNANPEPDGKAYRIDFLLSEGKRVAGCEDSRRTEQACDCGRSKQADRDNHIWHDN
jgi:hypothetical protein